MFQSSPALSDERYGNCHDISADGACFNPRPPFRTSATFNNAYFAASRVRFQSSPALSDERYTKPLRASRLNRAFQSSPALSDERYLR